MNSLPSDAVVAAKLAVTSGVAPPVELTVMVGERCRIAAMSQYGRANQGAASPVLAGKDSSGVPLSNHGHAFYLPLDENEDGRIDSVVVYARSGLKPNDLNALASVQTVRLGRVYDEMRVHLCAVASELSLHTIGSPFERSKHWVSATPYVMPRHPKVTRAGAPKLDAYGNQLDSAEQQIVKEWNGRIREDSSLSSLAFTCRMVPESRLLRWNEFTLRRAKQGSVQPMKHALGFHLVFTEPVSGPIALGYASHFGLGLFMPDRLGE